MRFEEMGTERVQEKTLNFDALSPLEAARLMSEIDLGAQAAVARALEPISRAAEAIARAFRAGGRLVYAGAGTSGRLGVLDASECPPTFGVSPDRVVGIIAGGDRALRFAVEGAEDDPELGKADMAKINLCDKDALVAISASGYAPYCVGALDYARSVGAFAVALTCNEGSVMASRADLAIEMPTGAETISGSTRLKAGTATKMALNMLSTIAMAQSGKVYQNLMVDMRPTNVKLKARALRMIQNALGTDAEAARALLDRAENVKTAIVMGKTGADRAACEKALAETEGFARKAIEKLKETNA